MLSCAASVNFSWVDSGGSCVLALTAPKFGTSQNIRLVCWPWVSSFLFCGAGAWSGTGSVLLSAGGAALGLVCDCELCGPFSRGLDSFVTGVWDHMIVDPKRIASIKVFFVISSVISSETALR